MGGRKGKRQACLRDNAIVEADGHGVEHVVDVLQGHAGVQAWAEEVAVGFHVPAEVVQHSGNCGTLLVQ